MRILGDHVARGIGPVRRARAEFDRTRIQRRFFGSRLLGAGFGPGRRSRTRFVRLSRVRPGQARTLSGRTGISSHHVEVPGGHGFLSGRIQLGGESLRNRGRGLGYIGRGRGCVSRGLGDLGLGRGGNGGVCRFVRALGGSGRRRGGVGRGGVGLGGGGRFGDDALGRGEFGRGLAFGGGVLHVVSQVLHLGHP